MLTAPLPAGRSVHDFPASAVCFVEDLPASHKKLVYIYLSYLEACCSRTGLVVDGTSAYGKRSDLPHYGGS